MKLVKYEAARQALAEANSVDEVKDIRDKAAAVLAYGKQAKDTDLMSWAAEIKVRAERRAGQLLKEMDMAKPPGINQHKVDRSHDATDPPTLSEMGLDKSQSSRWQKIAAIPEDKFDEMVSDRKGKEKPITTQALLRWVQQDKNEKLNTESQEFNGKYGVIVIDPPWDMKKIERSAAIDQVDFEYPTMNESQLSALDLPFSDHCHVFLWATQKHLPMALRLFDAWNVKYVLTMVWHKPGGFQPFGLPQYNCEFVLYGRVGAPVFVDTKAFNVCFDAPRGKHSEKPQEFYDLISRVTDGKRIDVFNRRKIAGFDTWGNESK